jgi:hypothetical protein
MSNLQLYIAVGLPTIAAITSLIVSLVQIRAIREDLRTPIGGIREDARAQIGAIRGRSEAHQVIARLQRPTMEACPIP